MIKDARINWFVFLAFIFSCSFWWALAQSLLVRDGRWGAISVASAVAMWMLIDRKMKHDELLDGLTRLSVQVSPQKDQSGRPVHSVRLQVQEDGQTMKYAHLPMPHDVLAVVARATLNERPFTHTSWCGKGKLLSRAQFGDLRDWLLKAGYAAWVDEKNRSRGISMTAKGNAFWKALAK